MFCTDQCKKIHFFIWTSSFDLSRMSRRTWYLAPRCLYQSFYNPSAIPSCHRQSPTFRVLKLRTRQPTLHKDSTVRNSNLLNMTVHIVPCDQDARHPVLPMQPHFRFNTAEFPELPNSMTRFGTPPDVVECVRKGPYTSIPDYISHH
jgi:hypothetical protein